MSNEEQEIVEHKLFPTMRIYLNLHNEEHDQLNADEFMELVGEKGIPEFIRGLIDKGIVNVYYCCFDSVDKVI
jgi:hypothetical protein